ncbi:MAG TPA: stage 0 sporulation protein, partial [Clostridium perfringens]|nr:stage 0 sporulation protein [Clostridium perfringens]
NKIIFYFIAEGRVDFRELVKTLASIFKTRIELRQIGVRDEAKSVGGIGTCGRSLCCSTFLGDFTSVSIKMAKEQNLSLNPSKISGMCGRLMCCLKYEQDTYEDIKQRMPNIGSIVDTKFGEGEVIGSSILKERVRVKFNDEQEENIRDIKLDEIQVKYNNLKNFDEDKNNQDLFEENYDCEEFSKYFINDILEKNKDDY